MLLIKSRLDTKNKHHRTDKGQSQKSYLKMINSERFTGLFPKDQRTFHNAVLQWPPKKHGNYDRVLEYSIEQWRRKNPCCFMRNCSEWSWILSLTPSSKPSERPRALCWVRGLREQHTAKQPLKTAGSLTLLTCQRRSISLVQIRKQLVTVCVLCLILKLSHYANKGE